MYVTGKVDEEKVARAFARQNAACGWLTPEGIVYECATFSHWDKIVELGLADSDAYEVAYGLGWGRLGTYGSSIEIETRESNVKKLLKHAKVLAELTDRTIRWQLLSEKVES